MYHGHGSVLECISYSPELMSGVSYVTSILNEQEEPEFEASYDDFEAPLTPHTLNHCSLWPFVPIILITRSLGGVSEIFSLKTIRLIMRYYRQ